MTRKGKKGDTDKIEKGGKQVVQRMKIEPIQENLKWDIRKRKGPILRKRLKKGIQGRGWKEKIEGEGKRDLN